MKTLYKYPEYHSCNMDPQLDLTGSCILPEQIGFGPLIFYGSRQTSCTARSARHSPIRGIQLRTEQRKVDDLATLCKRDVDIASSGQSDGRLWCRESCWWSRSQQNHSQKCRKKKTKQLHELNCLIYLIPECESKQGYICVLNWKVYQLSKGHKFIFDYV